MEHANESEIFGVGIVPKQRSETVEHYNNHSDFQYTIAA